MKPHIATRTVHAGEARPRPSGAVTTPIAQCSTYAFESTSEIQSFVEKKAARDPDLRYEYGRYGNPTIAVAERRIADLEQGEAALLFASGMSALTTALLSLLDAGDHLIVASSTYRQTRNFVIDHLARWRIDATFVADASLDEVETAIEPRTRAILFETPTNPFMRVLAIDRLASIAKERGILTLIDSTLATPINLRPLDLGVDLVIHSATKYLGGHNDLLGGAVVGRRTLLRDIEKARGVLGGVPSPFDAYLLIRGLKTLALRVERQNRTGLRIAERLLAEPAVEVVHYPGLAGHPDHETARRLLSGFGGVVSFEVRGTSADASRVIDALRIPHIGPTFGGVESIAQQQALFISPDEAERRRYGIPDTLIRYAAGIEDPDDLIADLTRALAQVGGDGGPEDSQ